MSEQRGDTVPEAKSLLQRHAEYYTKNMGLPVFPCNGKTPATPHGCKDATTDPAQIAEWWGGSTYNVAIATGNGIVVLDVDGSYAMICDGKRRTLEKPKRKKYKHLSATKSVLEIGLLNSNKAIRKALSSFNDN